MSGYTSGAPGAQYMLGTNAAGVGGNALAASTSGLNAFNPANNYNIPNITQGANAYVQGINIPGQVAAAMQPAEEAARDVTLPGMASANNIGGNANNSRGALAQGIVERGLGEQAGNLAAELGNQAYAQGAGLASTQEATNNQQQLAALTSEGQLGASAGALGSGALSSSIGNQGQVYGIQGMGGQGLQGGNQAALTNQLQGYNFGQSSPFQALQNFWNIIGSGSWGGTSNTNSNTTYSPSLFSTIGGLMGAGGSLLGSGPSQLANGTVTGGSGLLGLLAM